MNVTLHIKTSGSNEEIVIKFDNVYNLHCYNTIVDFDVAPGYTQSENASEYNVSTTPYHKKIYDVVDCHVEA